MQTQGASSLTADVCNGDSFLGDREPAVPSAFGQTAVQQQAFPPLETAHGHVERVECSVDQTTICLHPSRSETAAEAETGGVRTIHVCFDDDYTDARNVPGWG